MTIEPKKLEISIEQIEINGLAPDEKGYLVNGVQKAAVRLTRASGAAASMFGFTACAFAIDVDDRAMLTANLNTVEDSHTVSCKKADLFTDNKLDNVKVAAMKEECVKGALQEMMNMIAQEQAFDQLKI